MSKPKSIDRHVEPEMIVYPFRLQRDNLDAIGKIAKKQDRTRASVLREAVRKYLEGRSS
jgi:predicted transcriptional regulator